jgi:adenylate cyclase
VADVTAYSFGRFTIDLRAACLRRDGTAVPLRPKSFDVLHGLAQRRGRVVSKDELMDSVWVNIAVTENSLVQCIKEIRQALQDDQQQIIQTVAKRGYLFVPAVVEHTDGALPAETPTAAPQADAPHSAPSRKWIAYAAGVAALLCAGAGIWFWTPTAINVAGPAPEPARVDVAAPNRLSIAVMPFAGGPDAAAGDYFSAGIAEDISTALGRFPELTVVTQSVVSRARNAGDAGRQLNVRYLVDGNVRRSSERVRLAVRLNEVASGVLVWSESYDAPGGSILAIQEDIALRVAGALAVKLTNIEQNRAGNKEAGSMEAYDLVLRGRDLATRLNRTSHSEARKMFERAIALDSSYAAAYIGLGRLDLSAVAIGWTSNADETLKRAELHARKALSIDEFSPAAHALLGRAYVRMADYERAIDVLKRALTLNPSNPEGHAALGEALLWNGEPADAIKSLETAIAIDPRRSAEDLFNLGAAYFIEGRSAEAQRAFERATTRNEGNLFIFAMLAAIHAESGREVEAQAAVAEVRKLNPFFDAQNFGSLFKQPEHRQKMADAMKKAGF